MTDAVGRIVAVAASGAVAAAVVVLPSGCSSGAGCRAASVHVVPPHVTDTKAAFDVSATLTASGHPVSGANLAFWGWGRPPGQTSSVGTPLGSAVTNAVGTATLHVPAQGAADVNALGRLSGTEFVRVSVDFGVTRLGGQAYCAAKGEAQVACGTGECTVSR
ncbi:hypothetical protein [Catenulispora subtropica]|uniref:Lipoprotein n=1 Tax=Catenulispora subtropica TaxID=450798 RepID=A0ABP5CWG2_9ACTN